MCEQFDLKALAKDVVNRPAPETCAEIAALFSDLPPKSWIHRQAPTPEQNKAFALLGEKAKAPTAEEVLFMAEVYCGKYHRIRPGDDCGCHEPEKAEAMYKKYYEMTGCPEVKYILDNFKQFSDLCWRSTERRQRHDDLAPYRDTPPSTSRDPDSDEWKSGR